MRGRGMGLEERGKTIFLSFLTGRLLDILGCGFDGSEGKKKISHVD